MIYGEIEESFTKIARKQSMKKFVSNENMKNTKDQIQSGPTRPFKRPWPLLLNLGSLFLSIPYFTLGV